MTFWNNNIAAPNFLMTLPFYSRRPAFFRTDMPPLYPDTFTFSDGSTAKVKRLFNNDAPQVSKFLEDYYTGDDWRISNVSSWIGNYLGDIEVLVLGLIKSKSEDLVAIICSVPLSGPLLTSHGGLVRNIRVIEGLCVAPLYRGKGVAGYMIRHADAFTSYKFGVCAHLWSNELDKVPFLNTALSVDKYGYTFTGLRAHEDFEVSTMTYDDFVRIWISNSSKWVIDSEEPCLVATVPSNRRNKNTVYVGYGGIMVVSNTERTSIDRSKRIYEIVWSGRFTPGYLKPADDDFDFKQLADGVAALLGAGGVLFGTSSPTCGGVREGWAGWTVGRSGYHGLYMYNYMPPAFGACRIHIVRDEL